MSTDASTIDHLVEQAMPDAPRASRRMFGEYALYVDTKVVAFVCDNQVFLKPNELARPHMLLIDEQPAYPGSKMYWRLGEELDDRDRFRRILERDGDDLPLPRPKGAKATPPASAPRASTARASSSPRRTNASTSLEHAPNLGPKSLALLAQAGLKTMAQLRNLGAAAAYVKIKRKHPSATMNLLWALEGALTEHPLANRGQRVARATAAGTGQCDERDEEAEAGREAGGHWGMTLSRPQWRASRLARFRACATLAYGSR